MFRLTKLQQGYPRSYDVPPSANTAGYETRGWCVAESAMAHLVKRHTLCLDLSRFSGNASSRAAVVE